MHDDRALVFQDLLVGMDSHNQGVAQRARLVKRTCVAVVEEIETTVDPDACFRWH